MPRGPRTKRWQSSARLTALFRLCRSGSSSGSRINNFSDSRRRPKDGSLLGTERREDRQQAHDVESAGRSEGSRRVRHAGRAQCDAGRV